MIFRFIKIIYIFNPQSRIMGPMDPPTCSKSCHLNSISPSSLCLQVSYLWYVGCFQSKFGLAKRYGYRVNDRNLKLVRIRVTSTVLALSRLLAVLAIGALFVRARPVECAHRTLVPLPVGHHVVACLVCLHLVACKSAI